MKEFYREGSATNRDTPFSLRRVHVEVPPKDKDSPKVKVPLRGFLDVSYLFTALIVYWRTFIVQLWQPNKKR